MEILRSARKKRGLTLAQLSAATGIPAPRLSEYELGKRLPRETTLVKLAEALGILDLLIPRAAFRRGTRRRRYFHWVTTDFRQTWNRLYTTYINFLDLVSVAVPAWFKAMVRCDSAVEALAWLFLLEKGATARTSSPYLEGWDYHPMVDERGRAIGSKLLACLAWKASGVLYVLWPQIWLRTHRYTYRVDGLLRVQVGGTVSWVVIEIDGDGHRDRFDARRSEDLDVPVVRFSQVEVESVHFPTTLCRRVRHQLGAMNKAA